MESRTAWDALRPATVVFGGDTFVLLFRASYLPNKVEAQGAAQGWPEEVLACAVCRTETQRRVHAAFLHALERADGASAGRFFKATKSASLAAVDSVEGKARFQVLLVPRNVLRYAVTDLSSSKAAERSGAATILRSHGAWSCAALTLDEQRHGHQVIVDRRFLPVLHAMEADSDELFGVEPELVDVDEPWKHGAETLLRAEQRLRDWVCRCLALPRPR